MSGRCQLQGQTADFRKPPPPSTQVSLLKPKVVPSRASGDSLCVITRRERGTIIWWGEATCMGQSSPSQQRMIWPSLEAESPWIQTALNTNGVHQANRQRQNWMSYEWSRAQKGVCAGGGGECMLMWVRVGTQAYTPGGEQPGVLVLQCCSPHLKVFLNI